MKKKRLKHEDLVIEAAELANMTKFQNMTEETRQRIHDELLLHPSRVDALLKTLCVLGFFEWEAELRLGLNPLKTNCSGKWREVCMSIAAHHVAHKDKWKEKR